MELIVLGASGTWPVPGAATSGYLVRQDGFNLWMDAGSGTLANLQREGKAVLQIVGRDNLLFLLKGSVRTIKERVEASPFPIAMMEMSLAEVRDQAWPGVVVSPLAFQWRGPAAVRMAVAERAVLTELREWRS